MDPRPIGMFDSGVGGLTVARAVAKQLPDESIVYVGDSAREPYGPRPAEEVREFALEIMDRLVATGVKMIVIACNTATVAALPQAIERYEKGMGIPVVDVVAPAVRRAESTTRNGRVGVIATQGTITSGTYQRLLTAHQPLEVTAQACPEFVALVEAGITSGPEAERVAEDYLAPVRDAGVDTLVLGCTHYPLMAGVIGSVMGEEVTLVTSSNATAYAVRDELERRNLSAPAFPQPGGEAGAVEPPTYRFLTTGDPATFGRLARRFGGPLVGRVHSAEELNR